MDDPALTFQWNSHIVLACITCGSVVLLTRTDKDRNAARRAYETVIHLSTNDENVRWFDDGPVNLFLPTVCSSCDKVASWTTFSISRSLLQTWQPYRAMSAFLGDLLMLG